MASLLKVLWKAVELIWGIMMMTIEQAIDRVHRIGQRLPVHVVRLVMDRTIEQKIIQLQQKKVKKTHTHTQASRCTFGKDKLIDLFFSPAYCRLKWYKVHLVMV